MQRKHKLTPQAHKNIIEAARTLPKLVRLNPDGTQQYRKAAEYKGATNYEPGKGYTKNSQHRMEPVFINHEVEMINRFWKDGEAGVHAYIARVNEIANKPEEKTEAENNEANESNS
jgi:hypothetical protein